MTTIVGGPQIDLDRFAAEARKAVGRGGRITVSIREGSTIEIEGDVAGGVIDLLRAVAEGGLIDVNPLPPELTTGQAADLLGVSRPTVVALVDDGTLPATRVGTHRRLRALDVLRYREERRSGRRAALGELAALSEDLGLYED